MILRELSSGQEINIGNVADFAFDKKGRYLAWTIDAQDKAGNGVAIREMENGAIRSLDSDSKAVYSRLSWTEEGNGLTALKGVDDKAYEDKLYSVLGFKDFGPTGPQKTVFNPLENVAFPIGMTVSPNRSATWTKDLSALLFGIYKPKKKEKPEGERGEGPSAGDTSADEKVDLVLWHWQDKRLQSMQQVQESADKSYSYLAIYRPAEKKFHSSVRRSDASGNARAGTKICNRSQRRSVRTDESPRRPLVCRHLGDQSANRRTQSRAHQSSLDDGFVADGYPLRLLRRRSVLRLRHGFGTVSEPNEVCAHLVRRRGE
jgi:hypothetical protein